MSSDRQEAFAMQFVENQGRLYGYIATLLPHRDDAEDVLQRTSLILWQKWDDFDESRGFLPWARGIAHNEVRNFLRRHERRNVHLSEPVVEMLAAEMENDTSDDRWTALTACLGKLQSRQRELVEQCYLGSDGVKAVAESLRTSTAAVYMRLHRVRKVLVECVNRELSAESR